MQLTQAPTDRFEAGRHRPRNEIYFTDYGGPLSRHSGLAVGPRLARLAPLYEARAAPPSVHLSVRIARGRRGRRPSPTPSPTGRRGGARGRGLES